MGLVSPEIDVFISAKSADYPYARPVYDYLSSKGLEVFFGPVSLPEVGQANFREPIDEAIDLARHMLVVGSSVEHIEAPWVKAEWSLFINEQRSGHKNGGNLLILAVGDLRIENLPIALRHVEVIRLAESGALDRLLGYVVREKKTYDPNILLLLQILNEKANQSRATVRLDHLKEMLKQRGMNPRTIHSTLEIILDACESNEWVRHDQTTEGAWIQHFYMISDKGKKHLDVIA